MADPVPASAFTHDEALKRCQSRRRTFETTDLPEETVRAIAEARMDPRHSHLDAMLDEE